MKMISMMASLCLLLTACGQNNASIHAVWKSDYNTFDLTNLPFNQQVSANVVIACDGSFGNTGTVHGVGLGLVELQGGELDGSFQFGHLAYVGASDPLCRDYTKESYVYKVSEDGNRMTLTMPNYPSVQINYVRQ